MPDMAGKESVAARDPGTVPGDEPPDVLRDYYRQMSLIQAFELRASEMYARAEVGGARRRKNARPLVPPDAQRTAACSALCVRDARTLRSGYFSASLDLAVCPTARHDEPSLTARHIGRVKLNVRTRSSHCGDHSAMLQPRRGQHSCSSIAAKMNRTKS